MTMALRSLSIGLSLGVAATAVLAGPSQREVRNAEVAIARDYVLASCLIKRYPGSSVANDAEAWAAALIQRGHISADSYARLAHLADTPPVALSSDGAPISLMDCMALYNSAGLPARIVGVIRR